MAALRKLEAWLIRLRMFWSARVDALERYLDRLEHKDRLTPRNGKEK